MRFVAVLSHLCGREKRGSQANYDAACATRAATRRAQRRARAAPRPAAIRSVASFCRPKSSFHDFPDLVGEVIICRTIA